MAVIVSTQIDAHGSQGRVESAETDLLARCPEVT
jgi:hypothetical protein